MHDKLSLEDLKRLQLDDTPRFSARQLELEELMLSEGRANLNRSVEKAKKRGNVSHLEPYRLLTEHLVEPIAKGLQGWLAAEAQAKRRRAMAYEPLKTVDPFVASLVAVRCLLDTSSEAGTAKALSIAARIGQMIEGEARMSRWAAEKPRLWAMIQRQLAEDKATVIHRRRVNTNRFNHLVADEIGWKDWSHDDRKFVGLHMLKIMVEHSEGRVLMLPDPAFVKTRPSDSAPYILRLDADTTSWLVNSLAQFQGMNPVYMPMVDRPAPWTGMWDGGYLTGILPRRSLIRFKADNVEQAKVALKELGNVDMPGVYDSVNVLQETPWQVNQRVLDVAQQVYDRNLAIAGIPNTKLMDVPVRPVGAVKGSDLEKHWRRAASKAHGYNSLMASRVLKTTRTLRIAQEFRNERHFFFPHQLDFRGRAYSIPVDFQPQGEDLARGILTAASYCAKPVTEEASRWLAIHCANCWDIKGTFKQRIAWVTKNEAMLRAVAADPLKNRQWAKMTDDCWQALAATFEWVRWLEEGPGMLSALPVRIDGTCNGIQHLAAMGRDRVGGLSVNLVPDDKPHDIYMEVAGMLEARLAELGVDGDAEDRLKATRWLQIVNGKIPRGLTKRPVMILPYGGTQSAYQKYIEEWAAEFDPEFTIFVGHKKNLASTVTREQRLDFLGMVNFLVEVLWEQVEAKLPAARRIQKWLQQCARLAAATNVPLRWVTPMGFVVRHFYGQKVGRKIETKIDGQRITLREYEVTKDMDLNDQMRGIPPNFTHSMDACVLQMAVNLSFNRGLDFITTIHDAFGAVAADMDILADCVRECFVRTHEVDVLTDFRNACIDVLDDEVELIMAMPQVPKRGDLNLEQVMDSLYFFQ